MGGKSHSRSRSRNGKKKHKKHKEHKNRSRSQSRSHDKGNFQKERKSRFSDKPPTDSQSQQQHQSGPNQGGFSNSGANNNMRLNPLAVGGGLNMGGGGPMGSTFQPVTFDQPQMLSPQSQLDQLQSLNILNSLKQQPGNMQLQDIQKTLSSLNDSLFTQTGIQLNLNGLGSLNGSGVGGLNLGGNSGNGNNKDGEKGESNPQLAATEILKKFANAQNPSAVAQQIMPNFNGLPGLNPNIANTLNDSSKIKRKIYVPKDSSFNYTGLIIGPKGQNQKRLEEITQCKILVRGKGSQKEGQPPQPDDDEEMHVLIVGDNESQVAKACAEVERIIFADEDTRNRLRQEQLKMVAQLKNDTQTAKSISQDGKMDPSLTTPYGPPSQDAYIIPVPKDCVGLVIGKGGETIRMLQERSGARRVQVALDNSEGSDMRNVFVEGSTDQVELVKKMLNDIVDNQRKMKQLQNCNNRVEYGIPLNMVGLVIGKSGETVKSINQRTGAFVALSREEHHHDANQKILLITGTEDQINAAKKEIDGLVENGIRHQQHLQMLKNPQMQMQQMMFNKSVGGMMPPQQQQQMDPMNQYMQGQQQPGMMMDPNNMDGNQMGQQMQMQDPNQQMQLQQQQQQQQQQPQMMMMPQQMGFPMQPYAPYGNSMMQQYQYMASEGPQIEETVVSQNEEGNEKKRRRNRR